MCKVIHTRHNWCQIFLQLLNFEQVLVKGGCEASEAQAAQTQYPHSKLESRIYCLLLLSVSLCYIEDIGLECFNMTEW